MMDRRCQRCGGTLVIAESTLRLWGSTWMASMAHLDCAECGHSAGMRSVYPDDKARSIAHWATAAPRYRCPECGMWLECGHAYGCSEDRQ